jgi:hypothetical protein
VWQVLDRQNVPYSAVWALGLLAVSEAFIFRMGIPRAQSLSLAILSLTLHWLLIGKHKGLFLLGFMYVWLYNAFPLILVIVGSYILAVWLIDKKLDLRPLLFSGLGLLAGLIINPYFPFNIAFILQHILPKLFNPTDISVGSEWYPYTTLQLLRNSPLALAAFVSSVLALGLSERRMRVNTATGFFIAIIFGLMLFQSRRFIEYFPPFALIFAAFAWSPMLEGFTEKMRERASHLNQGWRRGLTQNLALIIMLAVLLPMGWLTLRDAHNTFQQSKPNQLYQEASVWLIENTPQGERVFQTDWDDFPRLFFYNTHNTYLVGLDPTYLQYYDPDLYDLWVEITRGRVQDPSGYIRANFGASYVLSDLVHEGFLNRAERDPLLNEVYRDDEAVIFRVVDW